jgi:alcohol dehydrogenase class IV
MKPRKPKNTEPSLRDKLSAAYLEAFQADFAANGIAVIEALRNKSPEKYAEIAARLIAATEPQQDPKGLAAANSLHEVGRRLLQQVGLPEPLDKQIEQAIEANDKFIQALEHIKDTALQFEELGNGYAETAGNGQAS